MPVSTRRLSRIRRALWRLGALPYNAGVLLLMAAVMLESRGWQIRGGRR